VNIRRGDIVLVGFPFTDLTATKVRPAVVVSSSGYHRATEDALLAAISSAPLRRPSPTQVVVADDRAGFGATGLKRSSSILCGKLFAAERRLLLRRLGHLDKATQKRVDRALAAALGLGPWR